MWMELEESSACTIRSYELSFRSLLITFELFKYYYNSSGELLIKKNIENVNVIVP